jgi:hypothetical protein
VIQTSDIKTVLIIIHLLRASPRIAGLVKYLPEFGWNPVILTGATTRYKGLPARVIETPYCNALGRLGKIFRFNPEEDLRNQIKDGLNIASKKSFLDPFFNIASEVINYPCPDKNWRPYAVAAGRKLLKEERIDALISSSPPVIGHIIAKQLKNEFKTPWVADLRDLWSQNAYYVFGRVRKSFDKRMEIKTLSYADALTTISGPMAETLQKMHPGNKVFPVVSGFDPVIVNLGRPKLTEKFTITYTGMIYPGKRDPILLLQALKELLSEGVIASGNVEARFYGPMLPWLDMEVENRGLSDIVKQFGVVLEATALEKQRESQVLVLFDWDDPKEKGVYTGKIFEYLGSRRPVIATGGVKGNVIDTLLAETKAGDHAITVENVKNTLKNMYLEYKRSGQVSFRGDTSEINKYSQREMAAKFAGILSNISDYKNKERSV